MISITARNRLTETRSTPHCKCCNAKLQFSQPSYLTVLRVEIPDKVPRTFTVHICTTCNKMENAELIDGLLLWSVKNYDDLFAPEYMNHMNRVAKIWNIKQQETK